MTAALRRHDTRDKRIEKLEGERDRLKYENERLREVLQFLPPESFLSYYSLLVEAVYLTKQPKPEVNTHVMRRQGSQIPVRNYRAYRELRKVDQRLYEIKRGVCNFLNERDDHDAQR